MGSFFAVGSPMVISTPGGIDIGVLPSFEDVLGVAENRRLGGAWKAGTRNPGRVTVAPEIAFSNTLLRLGASIVVAWKTASIGRLESSS